MIMSQPRRSQISLRLLRTLQQIEDADQDIPPSVHSHHHEYYEDEPESRILTHDKPHSSEFNDFHEQDTGGPSHHLLPPTIPFTQNTRTAMNFPPQEEYNSYDTGLSLVTEQLKHIQETQDIVLAELRMDIEQLNCDNLALRLCNDKLMAENQHLQSLVSDLSKTSNILREHLKEESPKERHHHEAKKSFHHFHHDAIRNHSTTVLTSLHSLDPQILVTSSQQQEDCNDSLCESLTDPASLSESRGEMSKKSETVTEKKSHKGKKKKQIKIDQDEKTRCFEFLRRRGKEDNQND